jgi:hypothetical protein
MKFVENENEIQFKKKSKSGVYSDSSLKSIFVSEISKTINNYKIELIKIIFLINTTFHIKKQLSLPGILCTDRIIKCGRTNSYNPFCKINKNLFSKFIFYLINIFFLLKLFVAFPLIYFLIVETFIIVLFFVNSMFIFIFQSLRIEQTDYNNPKIRSITILFNVILYFIFLDYILLLYYGFYTFYFEMIGEKRHFKN